MLGIDGIVDFNALHSRQDDHEVQFYALDGDDLRSLPFDPQNESLRAPAGRRALGSVGHS